MPLAQPSLYGEDEEDLHPPPTAKYLVLALDPEPLGSARRAVRHASGRARPRCFLQIFLQIWAGASGVLVRSRDGRTVHKLFYLQVLQSSYKHHHAAARVPTTHVVEVLQRLTDVEAGSDITRVMGVTMAYAGTARRVAHVDDRRLCDDCLAEEALRLPEAHNITHGDLLPENVLVQRSKDGGAIARRPFLAMVDLFASKNTQLMGDEAMRTFYTRVRNDLTAAWRLLGYLRVSPPRRGRWQAAQWCCRSTSSWRRRARTFTSGWSWFCSLRRL
jgi:hypothetical protein